MFIFDWIYEIAQNIQKSIEIPSKCQFLKTNSFRVTKIIFSENVDIIRKFFIYYVLDIRNSFFIYLFSMSISDIARKKHHK